MMIVDERTGVITMMGSPLTIRGNEASVGRLAPDFTLLDNELAEVTLGDFAGKTLIIATVPSLDTSVCDVETRNFNEAAGELSGDVVVLTVSMDLPFAQKRWCGAAGVENVITLSDHRDASFGEAYGVLIKELRLLARAVFLVDKEGILRYVEIVKELTEEPDYNSVLEALARLAP
jgi:thiol peroxidase